MITTLLIILAIFVYFVIGRLLGIWIEPEEEFDDLKQVIILVVWPFYLFISAAIWCAEKLARLFMKNKYKTSIDPDSKYGN